jgi:hypothetical protein
MFDGFTTGETTAGVKHLSFLEQAQATIDALVGESVLYLKDAGSGVLELYVKDGAENIVQLTSGGKILVADANGCVMKTGDQTIAGTKTFTTIPVLPESDPTTDNQAVRKAFITATPTASKGAAYDGSGKLAGSAVTAILGAIASKTVDTAYLAASDGLVVGYCTVTWVYNNDIYLRIGTADTEADVNAAAGTYVARGKGGGYCHRADSAENAVYHSFCVPVLTGKWWKAAKVDPSPGGNKISNVNLFWFPVGS